MCRSEDVGENEKLLNISKTGAPKLCPDGWCTGFLYFIFFSLFFFKHFFRGNKEMGTQKEDHYVSSICLQTSRERCCISFVSLPKEGTTSPLKGAID